MAIWSTLTAPNLADFIEVLNGVVVSSKDLSGGAEVDGLTIIIDTTGTPREVTFAPAKSRAWTLEEIVAAINAGHADLAGVAHIKNSTPGSPPRRWLSIWKDGGATVKNTGTGNATLGFSTTADQVQAVKTNTVVQRLDRDVTNQGSWVAVIYE